MSGTPVAPTAEFAVNTKEERNMPFRKKRRSAYRDPHADDIARGLGWFSVGIGLAQILAPRAVCRIAGLPQVPAFTRLCGIRELVCGIGILTQRDPTPWLKARIAGDAMDFACLVAAAPVSGSRGARLTVAAAAVAGVTVVDVYCSRELSDDRRPAPLHVRTSLAIARPPEALYRFWRNLSNLPTVMPHLKSVSALDAMRSHWSAVGPGGAIEWDSEIIDDAPNERLAWRSLESAPVYNAGSVCFDPDPAGGGTVVTVELLYDPPLGTIGASLAKLLGRGQPIRADLSAFKQLMESGA
jgi:uncharacterized membrane protein